MRARVLALITAAALCAPGCMTFATQRKRPTVTIPIDVVLGGLMTLGPSAIVGAEDGDPDTTLPYLWWTAPIGLAMYGFGSWLAYKLYDE